MEQIERELSGPVAALLAREGYPLVMPAPALGDLEGRGEFAMEGPGGKPRRVDVVAARWDGDRHVEAVAIECKATVWDVYDALGQAVQYQSVFDRVYVATRDAPETDTVARSTLVDLGLGHITAGIGSASAYISVVPVERLASRFQPQRKNTHIHCRFALGLAFLETANRKNLLRYGFWTRGLNVWYAEEVIGHLQWNCAAWRASELGTDVPYQVTAGLNVERVDDVRRICDGVSAARLDSALRLLPPEYLIEVMYNPNPPAANRQMTRPEPRATTADAALSQLRACPKGYRPQLSVSSYWPPDQLRDLTRTHYVQRLTRARQSLDPVMTVLRECYD